MSTILSISTCTNEIEASSIYKSVYSNFSKNTGAIEINIEKWLTEKEIKSFNKNEIILTGSSSGNKQQALIHISEKDLSFHLDNIVSSKEKIIANIPFHINSEYIIGIDLELYGLNYLSGFEVKNEGHIRALFNFNDLNRPLSDILDKKSGYSDERLINDEEYRLAVKLCNDTFEKIFQTIAFASDKLNHTVGYIESGVPLPMFSFSMFHRNEKDFMLDLWRNYIGFNFDIEPIELYRISDEKLFIDLLNRLTPKVKDDFYYQQLNTNYPDAIKFIKKVNLDKLKAISTLSSHQIQELIESTNTFLESDVLNLNIEVKKFKNIYFVYGLPLSNIWKFYETFYELA